MQASAYIKNVHISPKKLRFLLRDIKKRKPAEVLHALQYSPQKGARIFYKAIKSAIYNAKNNLKAQEDGLIFKTLTIEQGRKLKRFKPGGRGTASTYFKRYAHIRVILEVKEVQKETKEQVNKAEPAKIVAKK